MAENTPKTALLTLKDDNDKVTEFEDDYNNEPGFFGYVLDHEAPIPVCDAIAFLRANGRTQQGLFRTPGNLARVKEIMEVYNKRYKKRGRKIDPNFSVLNEVDDIKPNDVASLLKKFFNELKEPLIPEKFKRLMMFIIKAEMSKAEKENELHEILGAVPSPNKEVAGYVLSFLRDMLEYQEATKMDAKNLGMCLAVCFFRGTNSAEQIMLSTFGTLIIETFISSNMNFPEPREILIAKNTVYDEFFIPTPPLGAGETRGSSIFGSFRNSSLLKTFMGPGKNQNKQIRSVLEDVPITHEESSATGKQRNSKDNDAASLTDVKDSTSQGSNEAKKIEEEEEDDQQQSITKLQQRARKNSYNSHNNKTMKNLQVHILGVKQSDTLLELRERNKDSPALPPENAPMSTGKRKTKKNKKKNSAVSNISSQADSSVLFSAGAVQPTTPSTPELDSKMTLPILEQSIDPTKSEDAFYHINSAFESNVSGARQSFLGMRFNAEEAEQLKAERRKKRKQKRGHHNRERTRSQESEEKIAVPRALPPTPPNKPVTALSAAEPSNETQNSGVVVNECIDDEI